MHVVQAFYLSFHTEAKCQNTCDALEQLPNFNNGNYGDFHCVVNDLCTQVSCVERSLFKKTTINATFSPCTSPFYVEFSYERSHKDVAINSSTDEKGHGIYPFLYFKNKVQQISGGVNYEVC